MGNTQTTDTNNKSLKQIVDFIATNYILTQNFQDMRKLSDMKYCNKLVLLTSKVFENKLRDIDIEYLAQRTRDGQEINVMANDKVKVINKSDLPNLDVKVETDKRRLCIGIAKYYVKIAHIYAAIVTTIKPNYVYNEGVNNLVPVPQANQNAMPQANSNMPSSAIPSSNATASAMQAGGEGEGELEVGLPQKQSIPTGSNVKVKINNICSNRLNALINNQDFSGENLTVKPNFCRMNLESGTNKARSLASEPGIPELMTLYYNHGGFTGFKSKEQLKSGEVDMKAVYLKDVQAFYKLFTGEEEVPAGITTFSDIPLKAYHLSKGCQPNGIYTMAYKGTVKDKLFKTYADHIKEMMKTTEANQTKLLAIIDRIFVFNVNPVSKEREVTIKMGLTEKELGDIVEETRKIIVNLYIKCEEDFLEGLEIFEAIVENQIKDTTQVQAAELQSIIDSKMGESDLGDLIEPVAAAKAKEEKAKEKEKENIRLKIAEREKTPAVLLEPATLEPAVVSEPVAVVSEPVAKPATLETATLEPAKLEPVTLEPVTLEPVTLDSVVVVSKPAVFVTESAATTSEPVATTSEPVATAEPLPDSFVEKAKIYLPSFVKGGVRRY